jgi:hypothetical protein
MSGKKPSFYGKFIILTNGAYKETGFLGLSCVSPEEVKVTRNFLPFTFLSLRQGGGNCPPIH